VAIITKEIFDNPYVDIGKNNDICILCRRQYMQAHKDETEYRIDEALKDKLAGKRVFKIFQNSNTPFVLCADHIHEIDAILQEES
jgi:hypothetical protein